MKKIWLLGFLIGLALLATWQRHRIMILAIGSGGAPELLAATDEGSGVRWHDDYFTVQALAEDTFAIGEPRYNQQNFSYLILGGNRAVLFDAGPGHRDIREVAQSLTLLPITLVPSHFHYDHIATNLSFERVAVVDLPYLRRRANGNRLPLTWQEHLGQGEGFDIPTLTIDEWLQPGSLIDLGERYLKVLHTPGHTEDSISLLDTDNNILFTGDFIYPGPLFAFLPNSSMADYLQGTKTVLAATNSNIALYGAHRVAPPGAPKLNQSDVEDLQATLVSIRDGDADATGIYPRIYAVNDHLQLLAEPRWLQKWDLP